MAEKRKTMNYALEVLSLLCEWENCSKVSTEIEDFIAHIINEHIVDLYGDDLHCHWKDCEGFTENLPELRRHILLHAFHTKIKCHGRNLQKRKKIADCTLSAHSRNIIPELPEPLICCWSSCSEEFECPEKFYRHVDYHCESDDRKDTGGFTVCLWHGCQRNFADAHKLREHLRSHTQEKLIACPTCGGMFASRTKFYDHIQRQLPIDESDPEGAFICEYCSRKMSSERLLRDHMRHHGETLQKECMILREDLNERIMIDKPKKRGFKRHRLQKYERPIKKEKRFKELRRVEPYVVKQEKIYDDNIEEQQVNHYKCPYCDMTCPTPSSLQIHVTYRHSDNKPHACQYCDYRCKSENDLRKHLETHSMVPTYKCPAAGCSYASRSQTCYSSHYRKKHEGKQPDKYSCHLCEKICSRGNYLTKHLLNHHKFRWPSGHCRFRYRLHEDGLFRLQTVRYESLELSETMMCESAESVDDPNSLMNEMHDDSVDETDTFCIDQPHTTNDSGEINSDTDVPECLVLNLEKENKVPHEQNAHMNTPLSIPFSEENDTLEQEPVLINIVDAEDRTSELGGSILLIKTTRPVVSDQRRSVQLITKDSEGRVVLETAEIITQYECDDASFVES